MAHKMKDGRWRATIWVGGRRLTKRCRTQAQATRWEAERRAEKENPGLVLGARSIDVQESKCGDGQLTTFEEFAKRWLREYCAVEKAASQLVEDGNAIKCYLVPAFGDRPLHALTDDDLELLKKTLRARELAPKTINNVLGLAKKIAKTAVKWKVLAANPWVSVDALRVGKAAVSYWTPSERDGFLAKAWRDDPAFAALVAVAAFTGLRRGELAGLTWGQVDFAARLLRVDAVYCFKSGRRIGRTKGSLDAEFVPLNAAALAALHRHQAAGGGGATVFDTQAVRYARERLVELCDAYGSRRIRFHDLRHTFGSTLAMAGVELTARQRLMRHKTIAMTDRYTHLSPDFLRAAIESLTPGIDLAPVEVAAQPSARNHRGTLEPQTGFERVSPFRIRLVRTTA